MNMSFHCCRCVCGGVCAGCGDGEVCAAAPVRQSQPRARPGPLFSQILQLIPNIPMNYYQSIRIPINSSQPRGSRAQMTAGSVHKQITVLSKPDFVQPLSALEVLWCGRLMFLLQRRGQPLASHVDGNDVPARPRTGLRFGIYLRYR